MDPVPNHEFMELHAIQQHHHHHQHQPHCKRQCYVFSEITDIELPQIDIKQYNCSVTSDEKFLNCNKSSNENNLIRTFHNTNIIKANASSLTLPQESITATSTSVATTTTTNNNSSSNSGGKFIFIFGTILVCIALAGGIPLALQLRSSTLLEARLNFIKRLLSDSPLISYYYLSNSNKIITNTNNNKNHSHSVLELRTNFIGAVLWPINVPCKSQYLDAVQLTLEGLDRTQRLIAKTKELRIIRTSDGLLDTHKKDKKISVILGLNGGHTIGASLAVLRSMYNLGTRFISITSNGCTTPWAQASPYKSNENENNFNYNYNSQINFTNALSNFGLAVVHEMNRLGMLVEISRLSEAAMIIAIKTTKAPVLITNAVPLSLCNSSVLATIPDHILSLLPDNGGVFMINTERCNDRKLTIKEAIQIINYVRRITGINHIGLSGVPHSYPFLLAELARDRIWGNSAIKKLVGGNIMRVLKEVEIVKNRLPINEERIPHDQIQYYSRCKYPES